MTKTTPSEFQNKAARWPVPSTLADLIEAAKADPDLTPNQRCNVVSAIRRFGIWCRLNPSSLPAAHRAVAERFDGLHWKQLDISKKRFQNVRSLMVFGLNRYVRLEIPMRGKGLSEEWAALRRCLQDEKLRFGLSRLIGYCSARGIAPDEVDDAVAAELFQWMSSATLTKKPERRFRAIVKAWNKAAETVDGWPKTVLAVPSNRDPYCLKWEEFPASFRQDAEAWLARNADPDPLDFDAPPRPWSEASLKTYRFQIRQLVSALFLRGYDIAHLDGLADLVEIETAREALRFFLNRKNGATSSQIAGLAATLSAIARRWVKVDDAHQRQLDQIKARLAHRRSGLTEKNRHRLMQFADHNNLIAFLGLPQAIMTRLERKKAITANDARDMQVALAIEVLFMAPIRRHTLVQTDLATHFIVHGRGRDAAVYLDFPAAMVKNNQDLTFPIPQETAEVLDFYVKRCLPIIDKHGGTWLFPGDKPGTHKSFDQFSRQFSKTILRETGIEMNLHLMRHLGAKLYLDRNPGAYEVVRRVLGHQRLSTSVNNYTGLETEAAIRHFDAVILNIRDDLLREAGDD